MVANRGERERGEAGGQSGAGEAGEEEARKQVDDDHKQMNDGTKQGNDDSSDSKRDDGDIKQVNDDNRQVKDAEVNSDDKQTDDDSRPEQINEGSEQSNDDIKQVNDDNDCKRRINGDSKEVNAKRPMVTLKQMFRYATRGDVTLMTLGVVAACVNGVASQFLLIVFGEMIGTFVDDARANATYSGEVHLGNDLAAKISKFALYYVYIGLGVMAFAFAQVDFWLIASSRQTRRIRVDLLRAVVTKPISWFDTHSASELNSRLSNDVRTIEEGVGDKVSAFFSLLTAFVVALVVGVAYGWRLCLVVLAAVPPMLAAGVFVTYTLTGLTGRELQAYAESGAIAEDVISGVKTVIAFGGQWREADRYRASLRASKVFGIQKSVLQGAAMGLLFFLIFGLFGLSFWYGAKLVREEHYTISDVVIVFLSILYGTISFGKACQNIEHFASARAAAFAIWQIIDSNDTDSCNDGVTPSEMKGKIEMRDVTFAYPSRPSTPVLRGINLTVEAGQMVALVGLSGSGRTTITQLLCRLYDPQGGAVYVDDVDVRSLNVGWLRRHFGVVGQNPELFSMTIAENIRLGCDPGTCTQANVERAATEANAHDFIMALPLKYETLVGEHGTQLSGGQKQRIAIARALINRPEVLLLDEATSALDIENEAIVQDTLNKMRTGQTTIVIAHRLGTIRTADVIVTIRDGAVHEMGSHSDLMAKRGLYRELVENQCMSYAALEKRENESYTVRDDTSLYDSPKKGILNEALTDLYPSQVGMSGRQTTKEHRPDNDKPKETSGEIRSSPMSRILRLNSPEWPYITIGVITSLLLGAQHPTFAMLFSEILQVFAVTDIDEQTRKANLYSLCFVLVGIGVAILTFVQAFMFGISAECLTLRLRHLTFKAILRQEMSFFDDPAHSTGALTTRLSADTAAIHGASGIRIACAIQSAGSILVGVAIGFYYSWKLTLVLLAFIPLLVATGVLQARSAHGHANKCGRKLEQASTLATEVIRNIRTVATLRKEEYFVSLYEHLICVSYRTNVRDAHVTAFSYGVLRALVYFIHAVSFYYGAWLHEHDGLPFVDMIRVFASIVFSAMAVGQSNGFAPDYAKAKAASGRILSLIDRQSRIDCETSRGHRPAVSRGDVTFDDVHFRYPARPTVDVLCGLSMRIEAGSTVALVGSSGSGKTTAIELLQRFYDPNHGTVLYDGQPLGELHTRWLRDQTATVSQEPTLFARSLRDNIAYGDCSREVPMADIILAARQAHIHQFIESLQHGYDTPVGVRGAQLSGGQKQRVALARSLVRRPRLLLLDEATSALDSHTEKLVQASLATSGEGRTTVIVGHRLSSVRHADSVIVLLGGAVVEQGTHASLLARREGVYHRLYSAQM